jgi:hypothetical protein
LNNAFSSKYWRERKAEHPHAVTSYSQVIPYLFWEKAREERVKRLQIIAALVESGGIQDKRAVAIKDIYEKQSKWEHSILHWGIGLINSWEKQTPIMELNERNLCFQQVRFVFRAIDKWYSDHDNTLPESLEELVEHGYLAEMPVHPFTGERMEYFRDARLPEGGVHVFSENVLATSHLSREQRDQYLKRADRASLTTNKRTYLQLGKWVYVIMEPVPDDLVIRPYIQYNQWTWNWQHND